MFDWRSIPHPNYGNYGGAKNGSDTKLDPIDWMDRAFMFHDLELKKATKDYQKDEADCNLYFKLRDGDPNTLKYPIYGKIYRIGALIVFYIACSNIFSVH